MGSFKRDKTKAYMMPIMWGPSTCFRDKNGDFRPMEPNLTTDMSVVFEADPAEIDALLPENITALSNLITFKAMQFDHCGWLGGHGYKLLHMLVPVEFKGERDTVRANFVLLCSENHADPILAGREFTAYNKPWADIHDFKYQDGVWESVSCGWDDPVIKLKLDTKKKLSDEAIAEIKAINELGQEGKLMNWLYWPNIDNLEAGEPYADCAVVATPPTLGPDYPYTLMEPTIEYCAGEVQFIDTTWENMPMWYSVYHGLANLTIKRIVGGYRQQYNDPCHYFDMWRMLK